VTKTKGNKKKGGRSFYGRRGAKKPAKKPASSNGKSAAHALEAPAVAAAPPAVAALPPVHEGDEGDEGDGDDEGIDTASEVEAAEPAVNTGPDAAPASERGMKTVMRKVLVRLNDEQLARKGVEIGNVQVLVEAKKAEVAVLNDEKRKLEGYRSALGHALKSGVEELDVECERIEDITAKEIRIVRRDNGEVVEARTMTPGELQGELNYSAPNDAEVVDDDPAPGAGARTMAEEQAAIEAAAEGGEVPGELDDDHVEDDSDSDSGDDDDDDSDDDGEDLDAEDADLEDDAEGDQLTT
jgi:hypothetical protein